MKNKNMPSFLFNLEQCGHARKLFRLAKGLNELKALIDLL